MGTECNSALSLSRGICISERSGLYYHIKTTEGEWEDSVSQTLLDGFKIINNAEIFKY